MAVIVGPKWIIYVFVMSHNDIHGLNYVLLCDFLNFYQNFTYYKMAQEFLMKSEWKDKNGSNYHIYYIKMIHNNCYGLYYLILLVLITICKFFE